MYDLKLKFLPVLLVAVSAAGAAEITPAMNETINRVDVGRQEVRENGDKLVREANRLFADGQYMEARDKYLAAKKVYDRFSSGAFAEKSEYCRQRVSDCYYRQAEVAMSRADDLAQSRDFDEAIKTCQEALKFCDEAQKQELSRKIEIYEKRRDSAIDRENASPERLVPNVKAQEYQIQVLMEQGRKLTQNGEYGRAVRKFQEVLLINPFNADALQCLRAVNTRISAIGNDRYSIEHRHMMGEIEWKSATPYQPFAESAAQNLLDAGAAKVKPEEKGAELRRRLAAIKLPKVQLQSVTVGDAVDFIRAESVKNDPDKRGVNIVFVRSLPKKLNAATQNANQGDGAVGDAAPADGDQPREQANNNNENVEDMPDETIDLDIKNRSVIEVLDMLCSRTHAPKMRYQVDDSAVLISPENFELGGMLSEAIHINLPEGTTDDELKNAMISEGIEFRPGAGVAYFPKLGRVVVKNDSKNLELMKAYFENRRSEEAMIQLQIKLVEMTQKDIDELAFNWQYAVNSNQSPTLDNGKTMSRATIIQSSSNELLRYYMPDNHSTTMLQDSNYAFMWANSDGTKITANMFALDWADSKDVLASPRITTLPGHTAKIEMVTVRYFPEDWDTIDVDTVFVANGTSVTRATPQPNLDKEKRLGPIFNIRPEIMRRGGEKLIKLHLDFPIETFSDEWVIYDSTTSGGDDDDYIAMPVFNTRSISCDVILGDGETIVLGGVGKDDTSTINDKIPILGDLPIIGRLFQSKYSNASKNNLLIFLSGRLVKPDGSAYNPAKQIERGLPSFGRLE